MLIKLMVNEKGNKINKNSQMGGGGGGGGVGGQVCTIYNYANLIFTSIVLKLGLDE